ncbi:MAG TPA: zf-HC2 domain-containing protein [Verrucomicrobiota bacterium]|nr:zf-HC2 domain-containing protein [Verrucomicrobiota bacterium]HRZ38361.1 zf-HC2 domain-containing protein [Candidatus Paceibacterota bacterium]
MKCDQIQSLAGPYLDSELDVRTTGEIQDHLAACPDCARAFATQQQAEARLAAALQQGHATPALWERIEQSVRQAARARAAAVTAPSPTDLAVQASTASRDRTRQPGQSWWRTWLWPSPRFYAGVAAVWICIFALNLLTGNLPEVVHRSAPQQSQQSPETARAFAEQRQELAELLGLTDAPAQPPKPTAPPNQTHIWNTDDRVPDSVLNRSATSASHT